MGVFEQRQSGSDSDMMDMNSINQLCVNTIRTLAMDAVQKANSGHPGTPMGLAPVAYVLWTKFLRHNPTNPDWCNRDRVILSCGHASMLLYAMLHLTGYGISLDDIKNFRQWGSLTPGHPEHGLTPGVETTTGPLGQGCMNAVGMALAEAHLAAKFNWRGHQIVNHFTYVLCSDGDLMEGASQEAVSLAGHLGLGKLVFIYDDNRITIEGGTDLSYSDNVAGRFEASHWQVQDIGDHADDLELIAEAIDKAQAERTRPSLIMIRSHIAYGSPNKQDTPDAHGAPLGVDEVRATKRALGWPEDAEFLVPDEVRQRMSAVENGKQSEAEWQQRFQAYRLAYPELAAEFEHALKGKLPVDWDSALPEFHSSDGPMATRSASGEVLNAIAVAIPWLMSGSADLAPSTKTLISGSGYITRGAYANRNIAWGVREHLMCSASSGMMLHGGVRPVASTFFVFTDYARPAIRLAALMKLPVIYVMTHDSIGVGEDGPTHQPVEHLASLRAMPNLTVIRPADANEVAYAWRVAMENAHGPTLLVLSRQKLPILDRDHHAKADEVVKGGYVLLREKGEHPDIILIATGSEVHLALEAQKRLASLKIDARVVSLPCWEIFREQPQSYRDQVLPPDIGARLSIEAGSSMGWREWVGDRGDIIAIDKFGASAPAKEIFKNYGFTVDNIVARAKRLLQM